MKYRCAECKTKADCKHAFGIYWAYKSNTGQGCDHQFSYRRTPTREPLPPPTREPLPPPIRKPVQGTFL